MMPPRNAAQRTPASPRAGVGVELAVMLGVVAAVVGVGAESCAVCVAELISQPSRELEPGFWMVTSARHGPALAGGALSILVVTVRRLSADEGAKRGWPTSMEASGGMGKNSPSLRGDVGEGDLICFAGCPSWLRTGVVWFGELSAPLGDDFGFGCGVRWK